MKKIFVAIATRGGLSWPTHLSLTVARDRCAKFGIRLQENAEFVGGIPLARNLLMRRFMESDCDGMLTLDRDIAGFTGDELVRFVEAADAGEEGIMGAPYPGRDLDPTFLVSNVAHLMARNGGNFDLLPEEARELYSGLCPLLMHWLPGTENAPPRHPSRDHLAEVLEMGTGFLYFSRACAVKLCAMSEKFLYSLAPGHEVEVPRVFNFSIDADRRFAGEDYDVCRRWRAAGGRVWADTESALQHIGEIHYCARSLASTIAMFGPKDARPRIIVPGKELHS
jgi:hypothetical protein